MSTDPHQSTSPDKVDEPRMTPMATGESQWIIQAIHRLEDRFDRMEDKLDSVRKLVWMVTGGIGVLGTLITIALIAFRVFNLEISIGGG